MNWKEQSDGLIFRIVNGKFSSATIKQMQDLALDFISKEIIEKLIEDIPDESFNEDGYFMQSNKSVKQQLRDKWL